MIRYAREARKWLLIAVMRVVKRDCNQFLQSIRVRGHRTTFRIIPPGLNVTTKAEIDLRLRRAGTIVSSQVDGKADCADAIKAI